MSRDSDTPWATTPPPQQQREPAIIDVPILIAHEPKRPRRLPIVIVCLMAALAIWQIARNTLAQGLSAIHPEWALTLNPHQPDALLNIVDGELDELTRNRAASRAAALKESGPNTTALPPPPASSPAQTQSIANLRNMTKRALAVDPTSARAVRILAQLADLQQDETNALELSALAARRSKHEPIAIFRLARRAFDRQDYPAVLEHADILLRSRPDMAAFVYPMLARLSEAPEAKDLLIARLLQSPPWRNQFISNILPNITDARTPLRLLLGLQSKGQQPTPGDLRNYLNFLIDRQLPQIAYHAWLQLLTPEQLSKVRTVNNGRFTEPITGLPFNWTLQSGSGTSLEISTISPTENALRAKLNHGRSDLGDVSQVLLLSPGRYEFSARHKGELVGRRGLKWHVACLSSTPQALGETEMFTGKTLMWQEVKFTLVVPTGSCQAQRLRLIFDARSASERLVTGDVLFTGIEINRL